MIAQDLAKELVLLGVVLHVKVVVWDHVTGPAKISVLPHVREPVSGVVSLVAI